MSKAVNETVKTDCLSGRRLMQINTTLRQGATGYIASTLAEHAAMAGMDVMAAYGRGRLNPQDIPSGIKTEYIGSGLSAMAHGVMTRFADAHGHGSVYATRRLIRAMENFSPDIVHLHNIHGYYLNYPLMFDYLRRRHINVVWTLHDCWPMTGHCAYFSMQRCDAWRSGCRGGCPGADQYPRSFLTRATRNFNSKRREFAGVENMRIIAVSEWLRGVVEQSHLSAYPVEVIINGIDLDMFKPDGVADGEQLPVCVGSLRQPTHIMLASANQWPASKGLADVVSMAGMLPEDWKMVVAGLDARTARRLHNENGGRIIPLRHTSDPRVMAALYRRADVFVNPTYADSLPTVNIEAQLCGTPVACYDSGGTSETICPGAGVVCRTGDTKALLAGALSLAGDKNASADAARRARKLFGCGRMAADYMNVYREILS